MLQHWRGLRCCVTALISDGPANVGEGSVKPKVLLAPMNMANMLVTIVPTHRDAGFEAARVQYTTGGDNLLKFNLDRIAYYAKDARRTGAQFKTLQEARRKTLISNTSRTGD